MNSLASRLSAVLATEATLTSSTLDFTNTVARSVTSWAMFFNLVPLQCGHSWFIYGTMLALFPSTLMQGYGMV